MICVGTICGTRRHGGTAARRMLRSSKNIRAVQRLLGHSDIGTTAIYADAQIDDVREALEGVESQNSPGVITPEIAETDGAQRRALV
jgi:Phage integrase family